MATNELLRALALEARELNNTATEVATPTIPKAKPTVEFTITLAEYPDLIVTRKSPKVTKHLVILFTAETAFIKDEKGNNSELLTEENYARFSSGMPDIPLPNGYWAPFVTKGKGFAKSILKALDDEAIVSAIKNRYFSAFGATIDNIPENFYNAVNLIPTLLKEFYGNEKCMSLMKNSPFFCADIVHRFGLQNARDFMESFADSLLAGASWGNPWFNGTRRMDDFEDKSIGLIEENGGWYGYTYTSQIPSYKMDYKSFKEYMLYDAVRNGYGDNVRQMFDEWRDTLRMQMQIYGKIKEKYPDSLPTYHQQLAYKTRLMRQEIDEKNFARQVEKAKAFEGRVNNYVIIAPKAKQDFYDEATAQSNCLAGYVNKFTNGGCIILFMRKANAPEVPYITVEVIGDEVVQAKLARNRNPEHELVSALSAYIKYKAKGSDENALSA